jgi:hypothetical protein
VAIAALALKQIFLRQGSQTQSAASDDSQKKRSLLWRLLLKKVARSKKKITRRQKVTEPTTRTPQNDPDPVGFSTSQNKPSEGHGIACLAFIEAEYALAYSKAQAEGKADNLDPDTRAALESALIYLEQFWRPVKHGCLICQREISGSGDRTRVPSGEIVVVVPFDVTEGERLFGGLCADCTLKPQIEKEAEAWAVIGRLTAHPHRAGKGVRPRWRS